MFLSGSQLKSRPCSGIIWLSTQIQTLQWSYLALNSNPDPAVELSGSQLKSRSCTGIIWLSTQIQTLQWSYLALNSNPDPALELSGSQLKSRSWTGIIWLSTQIQTLHWNYMYMYLPFNLNPDLVAKLLSTLTQWNFFVVNSNFILY